MIDFCSVIYLCWSQRRSCAMLPAHLISVKNGIFPQDQRQIHSHTHIDSIQYIIIKQNRQLLELNFGTFSAHCHNACRLSFHPFYHLVFVPTKKKNLFTMFMSSQYKRNCVRLESARSTIRNPSILHSLSATENLSKLEHEISKMLRTEHTVSLCLWFWCHNLIST